MAESIKERLGAMGIDKMSERELRKLVEAMFVDMTALATSLNQLITDYNANATIATDTTATAVTLTTTA